MWTKCDVNSTIEDGGMMAASLVISTVAIVILSAISTSYGYPHDYYPNFKDPEPSCGYQTCPKVYPDKLNVHVVPHSHNEVGGGATIEQYYYGVAFDRGAVQYILDTATEVIENNPDRRFIYAEGAYFWKWWQEMTEEKQQRVKDLVNEGRLEFVGGSWTTNDEASTHYQSLIDSFTWGLRRLNDTFGPCGLPRVGWQIGTPGHSREMASIFAQIGYDGVFFSSIDSTDLDNRTSSKTMELVWEGSPNLGSVADLFTSVLYNGYNTPDDLCYDLFCFTESLVSNKQSPEYNVDPEVPTFMRNVNNQAPTYTTNNILLPLGGDFYFQHADMNFQNMDKIIRAVNEEHKEVNVIYSTPSCYLKAVNDVGKTYSTKQDDFLTFTDRSDDAHWIQYYTAKPTLKFYERVGNKFLQVGKQLVSLAELGQEDKSPLDTLREAMGVLQHQKAISGNAGLDAIDDYVQRLSVGIQEAHEGVESAMRKLVTLGTRKLSLQSCLQLNMSICDVTEKKQQFVVTVYNPLSRKVSHFVRFPVPSGDYKVQDPQGKEVKLQIVPIPASVLNRLPDSNAIHEVVFKAENLPPLGFSSYFVTKVSNSSKEVKNSTDLFIGSKDTIMAVLDENSGLIKEVVTGNATIQLRQNLYNYDEYAQPGVSESNIFGSHPLSEGINFSVYKGDIVDEIHQLFYGWASQVVRIYKQDKHVEFEWLLEELLEEIGIAIRFDTQMSTNSIFYTDTNGKELLQRKRNNVLRSLNDTAAVNYYPVTSRIVTRDTKSDLEVAVLTDRAQGGSSTEDGKIELMIHGSLPVDGDTGKPLNNEGDDDLLGGRGKHILVVGNRNGPSPNLAARERILVQKNNFSPWLFFTPDEYTFEKWQKDFKMEYSGLSRNLPKNVQILTLEPWREHELLLRLEHIMEKDEDPELSKPVQVNLQGLFTTFEITEIRETNLGGNQWIEDINRLVWKTTSNRTKSNYLPPIHNVPIVTLNPMEIRTLVITVANKKIYHRSK